MLGRLGFFFRWSLRQSPLGKNWVAKVAWRVDLKRFEDLGRELPWSPHGLAWDMMDWKIRFPFGSKNILVGR
jgi:hypothetical protein